MDAAKRELTNVEKAVLSELFEMAEACSSSTMPAVQEVGILVMERMRRIIDMETELHTYDDAAIMRICQAVSDCRKYLQGGAPH